MNQGKRAKLGEGVLMLFCLAIVAVVIIYGVKAFSKPVEQKETVDEESVMVYVGKAESSSPFGGNIVVEVTVDKAGTIVNIQVGENNATEGIGTRAIDALIPAILEAQSVDVDKVSNATITSDAIKIAVKDALSQAGIE
ncbi:MAG: FMN-binding protein [Lachnospiraceae bacterium]|nr:FMN-binding protein [Lachnospiraceae bacterium]